MRLYSSSSPSTGPYRFFDSSDVDNMIKYGRRDPLIALTLFKIRLLQILRHFQQVPMLICRVPQEIIEEIQNHFLITSGFGGRDQGNTFRRMDIESYKGAVEAQILRLYKAIQNNFEYVWPALITANDFREGKSRGRADHHSKMSAELLDLVYDAWEECECCGSAQSCYQMLSFPCSTWCNR